MPYTPQYVLSGWDTGQEIQQLGNTGLPATFNNFLFSIWVCLGNLPVGESRIVALAGPEGWGTIDITQPQVQLTLLNGLFSQIFAGTFTVPLNGIRSHILVSIDSIHQIAQVYVNDAPVAQSSGAGWSGLGPFNTSYFPQWGLYSSGSVPPGPGIADCFIANPVTFFDLNVTANRRRFINADLTAVDLGVTGSGPLGVQPPVFLTVRPGDTNPNHFASNNGFGGPWNYSPQPTAFEPPGLGCVAPTPPTGPAVPKTLIDAELYFTTTGGFVDFGNAANRRLFVSPGNGAQWLGTDGSVPLGSSPAVYLKAMPGQPTDFAQDNGVGGAFAITGSIAEYPSAPGCTPYLVTEAAGPAANPEWRLTVSEDGGRTWSPLVKPRSAGVLGEYLTRLRWLKMGHSRQRMIRLESSDPVRRNIVGIYTDLTQGMG